MLKFEWDEPKRRANLEKHGIDFADIAAFDWQTAVIVEDRRSEYGEPRFSATGVIVNRLHVVVFTPRADVIRIISLRRANKRDHRKWDAARN